MPNVVADRRSDARRHLPAPARRLRTTMCCSGRCGAQRRAYPEEVRSILTVTTLVAVGMADTRSSTTWPTPRRTASRPARWLPSSLTQCAPSTPAAPNAWAAFRVALKRCTPQPALDSCTPRGSRRPVRPGAPNDAYAQYFTGQSYLNPLTDPEKTQFIANVTFEPSCRNNWHIHHAAEGGGQILLVTDGEGWYQEWDKPARRIVAGDVVYIPANVKHCRMAPPPTARMSHVAFEAPGTDCANELVRARRPTRSTPPFRNSTHEWPPKCLANRWHPKRLGSDAIEVGAEPFRILASHSSMRQISSYKRLAASRSTNRSENP